MATYNLTDLMGAENPADLFKVANHATEMAGGAVNLGVLLLFAFTFIIVITLVAKGKDFDDSIAAGLFAGLILSILFRMADIVEIPIVITYVVGVAIAVFYYFAGLKDKLNP